MDIGMMQVDPLAVSAEDMTLPDPLDISFEGWPPEVFAMLDRLRANPHIDQYRTEKPGVTDYLKDPFKRYRDDLAVNWVLPNRLRLETERNVFSRLLKNDFGAGGCHDNLWMSFYRPETKRLKDAQVSHSVSPDGFDVGLYVGAYAKEVVRSAKDHIERAPDTYRALINTLLGREGWRFYFYYGSGQSRRREQFDTPLSDVPDDIQRADGIWIRRRWPRDRVLELGSGLVAEALDTVLDLWPIYRFYLAPMAEARAE